MQQKRGTFKGIQGIHVNKRVQIMFRLRRILKFFLKLLRNFFVTLFICEFLIYYIVIYQCHYNEIKNEIIDDGLKAIMISDTHMLGPFRGHPFDKLRREWQMKKSFQAAIQIFKPDVVFLLGDVFDEGNWVNQKQFEEYIDRFKNIFYVPPSMRMYVLHGNHDVNFHYRMHPVLINRFDKAFNTSSVQFIQEKKITNDGRDRIINFVSINSMALEGDSCNFCSEAEYKIERIQRKLNQLKENNSKPIILQHFPSYRKSDDECLEKNSVNPEKKFREKWETLSKQATEYLGHKLKPRAFFSGHSHHYCRLKNTLGVEEFTVASLNWRNINNPSFLLTVFTPDDYSVSKCDIPKETTVIGLYVVGLISSIVFAVVNFNLVKLFSNIKIIRKLSKQI